MSSVNVLIRLLAVGCFLFAGPVMATDVDEAPIGEAVERHMSGDEPMMNWMLDAERFEPSRSALARCAPCKYSVLVPLSHTSGPRRVRSEGSARTTAPAQEV